MNIQSRIIDLTPAYATALLANNPSNRPLDLRRATRLSEAITRGEWCINGDAIRIAVDRALLDGQHRCMAVVLSGISVQTFEVTGLPADSFSTIDTGGRSRTTGQVFAIQGEKHYNLLASVCNMLFKFQMCGNPTSGNPDYVPSVNQIEEMLKADPSIRESTEQASRLRWCKTNINPSLTAFAVHIFSKHDKAQSEEFFAALDSGIGLVSGSPVLLLRERFSSEVSGQKKELTTKFYKAALLFKAFRLFCDGATVKNLMVRTSGNAQESELFTL